MDTTKLSALSDLEFLKHLVDVSLVFKARFKKELDITGSFGEVHAALTWSLIRSTRRLQEGYDCYTSGNKRIQIKCGINRQPADTCSNFSLHDYDYFLYVHYSSDFQIKEAYILNKSEVDSVLLGKKKDKRKLRLIQIRNMGTKVSPTLPFPIK